MTVNVENNKSQLLTYSPVTNEYPWGIFDAPTGADVDVAVFDAAGAGAYTSLELTTHYTVDLVAKSITITAAGHTFIDGLGYTNERIGISRVIDSLTQENEYTNQGAFLSQTIEDSFDRVYYILQQLDEGLARSIKFGPFDDGDYSTDEERREAVELPSVDSRALGFLKFDAEGKAIIDDARGPAGPVGSTGPQGIQGIQGIQGPLGPQGPAGVQAAFNFAGVVADAANLPASASNGDAWLTTDDDAVHIWFDGQFYETFTYQGGISGATVDRVIYVTANGNDSNDGKALNRPKATISSALAAVANLTAPAAVYVYPGIYEEDGEIEVPADCAIVSAAGQYATEIHATAGNEEKNMLLVNSGSYVQGFTFRGQRVDDFDNPSGGFAVAFAPNALIVRSPYIRDIGQVSQANYDTVFAPLDPENGNPLVGKGGGVLLADRSVLNQNSIYPYMLAFGATPRSPNGLGYVAKNGAGINGISSLSIFQRCAFYALNGGQITLNNSGTQFGDFSMRAKGHTPIVQAESCTPSVLITSTAAADTIDAVGGTTGTIVNQMWASLEIEFGSKSASYEAFTRRDAANLIKSITNDLRNASDSATRAFAKGLFDYKGDPVFDVSLKAEFLWAFDEIETLIRGYITGSSQRLMISALIDVVKNTVDNPTVVKFPSLIESLGHQFNNAGAGVNALALPINFRKPGQNRSVPFSVVTEANAPGEPKGIVRWSGADEDNNQYFAGGTRINGITGRFEGRPFNSAVRQISRRMANSRGSY